MPLVDDPNNPKDVFSEIRGGLTEDQDFNRKTPEPFGPRKTSVPFVEKENELENSQEVRKVPSVNIGPAFAKAVVWPTVTYKTWEKKKQSRFSRCDIFTVVDQILG